MLEINFYRINPTIELKFLQYQNPWPIGFLIAWVYVLLIPFTACIEPLKEVCEAILRVINLPLTCAENMIAMKPLCEGGAPAAKSDNICIFNF
ncbi:hypothetical protein KUTeg_019835 [Tegillarca granosa]|uniref:Uncharacterized protein n=1 Tax=Tegillarca granosa TaxID=220873 RepID=A0ABQ9EDL6_TEGGR|nr:hypothetical protein KUTeg_019835 [Tegillarca granosa]